MTTARPRPLVAGEAAYAHERAAGATEVEALDVALHEALRVAHVAPVTLTRGAPAVDTAPLVPPKRSQTPADDPPHRATTRDTRQRGVRDEGPP